MHSFRWPITLVAMSLALRAIAQPTASARVLDGAPVPPPVVTTPRIYVLDCGTLANDRPEEWGLSRDEVKYTDFADMCFLIVHPKGTLLWDTGLNDNLVGRPLYENMVWGLSQIKFNTLRGQLAEIGYRPEQINYLVLSHSHFDHIGNANMFAKSVWLVEKPEWETMFAWKPGNEPEGYDEFKDLKAAKTVFIGPDYDVFGDGSVVVKRAFGHSPGNCVLAVKLRDTGYVLLAGDLWHYPEELSLNRIGARDTSRGTQIARKAIKAWVDEHHAKIWAAHFMTVFATLRKSPSYYE